MVNKATILKNKIIENKTIEIMGAHNGLSAKMVEKHGFDGIWASGFEISASYGKPDANILTMSEFVHAAKQITEASSLPVIADCDTGFGDLNNVNRMINEYEQIGVAGVCIEDKVFPKTNSYIPGRQKLENIDLFCEKLYAAQNAKKNPDFMVIARTEALIAGQGIDEALKRAHAYIKCGADMILIHSKQETPDEIFDFCKLWNSSAPIAVVPTSYPTVTIKDLERNNINMVIYANQGLRAAIQAVDNTLRQLKQSRCLESIIPQLTSMKEIFELQGMNEMISLESKIKDEVSSIRLTMK
ncbi:MULTISPECIES: phosphoenolpyruvate mutase [Bacillus]|uniref:Phosphoenolpyruvate mutase n=1 Tax=Bacillus rugosus TaxID=2715209 RepID=A0ACD3ZY64_9BACI|nr:MULTISPECIES: phosphoenolpyruvate mutase [Bacillus]MBY4602885.1 phosphoenolpyruvate mutase [Bacillus sp. SPARC3]UPV78973.1 phosphoenolpyruvate mutase [Bacillus rugosus]